MSYQALAEIKKTASDPQHTALNPLLAKHLLTSPQLDLPSSNPYIGPARALLARSTMTEQADAASSSSDAAAQRAAEQARLRKERREAKIKAGGAARLNKITGIGDRIVGGTLP